MTEELLSNRSRGSEDSMMKNCRWMCAVLLVLLASQAGALVDEDSLRDYEDGHFEGVVISEGRENFAVRGEGVGPGQKIEGELFFTASEKLLAKKIEKDRQTRHGYRPHDLKKGDRVVVRFNRSKGCHICVDIMIQRRPGGQVPPDPLEPPEKAIKNHELMNALQELEEKGTPLPARFLPKRQTPTLPVIPSERPETKK